MKSSLFVFILSFILTCTIFSFTASRIYAQEDATISPTDQNAGISPTQSDQMTVSPTEAPRYDLSYPGILPDSPFYKLKQLREKLILFFISDPRKKVDYYLLQTDKGILASAMLVDKHEIALAEKTALKAENNYTLITQEIYKITPVPDTTYFIKLKTAALKHQEVLDGIVKKVPGKDKNAFNQIIEFSKRNSQSIEKYFSTPSPQ